MASLFAHGFVAASAGIIPGFTKYRGWILLLGALAAICPDADVIAFQFGIPYGHPYGHRGASHSILFAVCLAILLTLPFLRSYPLFGSRDDVSSASPGSGWVLLIYFFLCTISHAVLDAMTNGGLGVAFFFPFDNTRYFFPIEWRLIQVSPIGARQFFSEWGLRVIVSELKFVAGPWVAALLVLFAGKKLIARIRR